jgi:hypothetical protein
MALCNWVRSARNHRVFTLAVFTTAWLFTASLCAQVYIGEPPIAPASPFAEFWFPEECYRADSKKADEIRELEAKIGLELDRVLTDGQSESLLHSAMDKLVEVAPNEKWRELAIRSLIKDIETFRKLKKSDQDRIASLVEQVKRDAATTRDTLDFLEIEAFVQRSKSDMDVIAATFGSESRALSLLLENRAAGLANKGCYDLAIADGMRSRNIKRAIAGPELVLSYQTVVMHMTNCYGLSGDGNSAIEMIKNEIEETLKLAPYLSIRRGFAAQVAMLYRMSQAQPSPKVRDKLVALCEKATVTSLSYRVKSAKAEAVSARLKMLHVLWTDRKKRGDLEGLLPLLSEFRDQCEISTGDDGRYADLPKLAKEELEEVLTVAKRTDLLEELKATFR